MPFAVLLTRDAARDLNELYDYITVHDFHGDRRHRDRPPPGRGRGDRGPRVDGLDAAHEQAAGDRHDHDVHGAPGGEPGRPRGPARRRPPSSSWAPHSSRCCAPRPSGT